MDVVAHNAVACRHLAGGWLQDPKGPGRRADIRGIAIECARESTCRGQVLGVCAQGPQGHPNILRHVRFGVECEDPDRLNKCMLTLLIPLIGDKLPQSEGRYRINYILEGDPWSEQTVALLGPEFNVTDGLLPPTQEMCQD